VSRKADAWDPTPDADTDQGNQHKLVDGDPAPPN